jgi:hypothetical protein
MGKHLPASLRRLEGAAGRSHPAARGRQVLLTPQKNGSGPFVMPETFRRQAW